MNLNEMSVPQPFQSTATTYRQKILVVDDLEENLLVLEKILSPLDVQLVKEATGKAALSAVDLHEFAVIILDVMMPDMDGYALADKLRENPKTHGIPLIFITGSQPGDHDITKGYELGAADYIVKPFAPGVLTSKVKSFLEIDRKLTDLEKQRAQLKVSESEKIKEAEASAERYRMLFQHMPSGFSLHEMIYDEQGKAIDYIFLRVNPAFESLTGLKQKDVIGKTVKEVLPGIEDHWIDLYATVVETGEPAFYENYSKELGKHFNVRAFRPSPGHFAVLFSDVTEQRENAEKLKITQFSVDNLLDAVYWADMAGKFIYVNDSVCNDLGYTREEISKLYAWDVDVEMTPKGWQSIVENLRNNGGTIFEREHLRKDGSTFAVEVKANYLNYDGKELICAFAHNITARNAARDKIVSSQRLLSSIIDTIPIRVFWKDLEFKFLGCNLAFAKDVGFDDVTQIIGKSASDLPLISNLSEEYCEDDLKVITTGESNLNIVQERNLPNMPKRWLKKNKIPLTDHEGKILGILGTYEDITESKQMQEAIEKRILALTRPLDDAEEIAFEELFNLQEIQKIQDEFAAATNVASIITRPDGSPITQPSNFTYLCESIIRATAKGCANCIISDVELGRVHPSGPLVQPCLSGGLWDAGASITVGGKHVASWLVGQVRDETQTEENMLDYAREIGADEHKFLEAFRQVPAMSKERFQHVADALFTLANQLSTTAYQNIQQARFIAEEKRRTQELRRLSTAIEQSPEVIVITDTNGVIEYVNPAFERSTGYSTKEALGQSPSLLKSGKHTDEFYADLWKTLAAGDIWNGHIINKRKDGSLYTEEAIISPVKAPDGTISNFVGIKHDISEELVREEQLQQIQKMEAIGQLAGGIAHDFNNILQAIMGFSDLLMLSLDASDEEAQGNLEQIQNAAQHAADLTRQLLAFSRKQHVEFARINLNDVVRKSHSIITSVLGETIGLELNLCKELQTVNADFRQMERAILNMTINARDAMPKGGVLRLQTENVVFTRGELKRYPEAKTGTYVCLSISDTGIGIPEDILGHIFEPFFTTKGPGKGTGLGLAAIYGIIQKHHGWITVSSEPGKGSIFNIYIPVVTEEFENVENTETSDPAITCVGNGQRILVVEDAEAVRELSINSLKEAGYLVISAQSAEEAETLFHRENGEFDLLFSDVILPGINGADLAVSLRKVKPDLNVLLCSGYSGNRIEETGADLKDFFFLEKPFSMKKLVKEVHQILST